MSGAICEIVATGPLATLQDAGRFGLRRLGVPWSGCLIDAWRRLACALVDNPGDAVVLEAFEAGLRIAATDAPLRAAVVGDATVERIAPDGSARAAPCWRSVTLAPGESLRIVDSGRVRAALVAVHGLDAPEILGSRSTYTRAGLGGPRGGPLSPGDRLEAATPAAGGDRRLADGDVERALSFAGLATAPLTLRALPGPQDDHFDADELDGFFADTRWTVGAGTDRMGTRLEGEPLVHRRPALADIVSDAILPGSVQVPASGEPIVMSQDAHTLGGYPKIATVIGADRPALALARPGTAVRFRRVDEAEAVAAARRRDALLAEILDRLAPATREPDTASLLACNLIDGVVDARAPAEIRT